MKSQEFEDKILALTDRLYRMVARLLGNRESAEDALQDIMVKLWNQRRKIATHPNITGFVILAARNHCLDLLKKKQPIMDYSGSESNLLKSEVNPDILEQNELLEIIQTLIEGLPKQQSEIILMRDIDGMEFTEIASAMHLKIEHVRVLLSRARKNISKQLQNIYSYEGK
jgi:RNA polymerase sigma factor (sigma-70 family)